MKNGELSLRLNCIADMVPASTTVVDVGCDHGFLSIHLVEQGVAEYAKAMDVREGPLAAAREHVREAGLEDRIECVLSDGLHALPEVTGDASLVIAGMGGPLILRILSECPEARDSFKELVLSPQSQIEEFRQGLKEQKLTIVDENMVYDEGKYYIIIRCVPGDRIQDGQTCNTWVSDIDGRVASKYGTMLLDKGHPVMYQYLKYEEGVLCEVRDKLDAAKHSDRYEEVLEEIRLNSIAQDICRKMG